MVAKVPVARPLKAALIGPLCTSRYQEWLPPSLDGDGESFARQRTSYCRLAYTGRFGKDTGARPDRGARVDCGFILTLE